MNQVEARLHSKTVLAVLVVFLDIQSAAVAKKIIDTEIYDKYFDYFFDRIWMLIRKLLRSEHPLTVPEKYQQKILPINNTISMTLHKTLT